MQSVPITESLTSPPFILNGRLVVRDDGDDVFFKEGRQAEGHGVDLDRKKDSGNETIRLLLGQTYSAIVTVLFLIPETLLHL